MMPVRDRRRSVRCSSRVEDHVGEIRLRRHEPPELVRRMSRTRPGSDTRASVPRWPVRRFPREIRSCVLDDHDVAVGLRRASTARARRTGRTASPARYSTSRRRRRSVPNWARPQAPASKTAPPMRPSSGVVVRGPRSGRGGAGSPPGAARDHDVLIGDDAQSPCTRRAVRGCIGVRIRRCRGVRYRLRVVQQAAVGDGGGEVGQDRAVQVVGDDDRRTSGPRGAATVSRSCSTS